MIDQQINAHPDWRGQRLAEIRRLIHEALPDVVEEWKWMGTPVWNQDGFICTGEVYAKAVKMTFAKGASLADPKKLFNASLDGGVRRAIDLKEGDKINQAALKALFRAAAAANAAKPAARKAKAGEKRPKRVP
ncbi:MAG TPA: DUF1801 domain-containing protein [bacterium]|nr:DUF1801 domain-containing protein [bacterium]